ncbi:MAG: hypothetical protein M3Z85_09980, partial [Acidobacteriota bacterium]|nr:hypothetical protein [Acidobacteriota bacterium]
MRARRLWLAAGALLSWHAATGEGLRAQNGRLEFANRAQLINCEPATTVPCFRIRFNILDDRGNALPSAIPAPRELAQSLTIHADGQDLTPFYAAATSGDVKSIRGRMALV